MRGASRGVARRYARALFEVADGEQRAALRGELEAALAALREHAELERALLHPAVSADAKKAIVGAAFRDASPLVVRVLELLATRGRLPLLPAIVEEYARALLAAAGVERAELVTATPLAAAEAERVRKALEAALGKGIELDARLDPELLGGVLVKVGGRHFDGTLRGRLAALRGRLVPA
jgi:F-type H+-transporting ATPase subunit delta